MNESNHQTPLISKRNWAMYLAELQIVMILGAIVLKAFTWHRCHSYCAKAQAEARLRLPLSSSTVFSTIVLHIPEV